MLLSAGAIIKRSIDVYKANWGSIMRYVGLMLLFFAGIAILFVLGIVMVLGSGAFSLSNGGLDSSANFLGIFSPSMLVLGIIFVAFLIVAGTWLQIAMSRTVRRGVLNQSKIGIGEEMKASLPFLWRTIASSLLVALIAILPFILGMLFGLVGFLRLLGTGKGFGSGSALNILAVLLAIYGIFHMIYFGVRFLFSSMAVMFDGKKVMEGLSFSTLLVKGRWWSMLWRTFAPMIVLLIPYYILAGLSSIEGSIGMLFAFMAFLFEFLVLIPIAGIPGVVLYESAKESSHPSAPLQS